MEHKHLKQVSKLLSTYFCYFKHDNILVVSEDKTTPFAYIIIDDKNYPNIFLLSLAVDYPCSERAVEIALIANKIRSVCLSEQFFISQNGTTYIGEDALKYYSIERQLPINEIEPNSPTLH